MDKKKVLDVDEEDNKRKITYDDLLKADTIIETKKKYNYSKTMIIKYIAVSVILFAIIFGSLILFRQI